MNKTATTQPDKTASFLPPSHGILQRKCACGNHTIAGGECADCAQKKMGLQRKLTIGASNDSLEQEADRIADQVMASTNHGTVSDAPVKVQRFTGSPSNQGMEVPTSVERVLASPGRPLEPALRQDMEGRFGYDFSGVRVHYGGAAEQSARELNANAYTVGGNIAFGAGQFAPETFEGQRLIAHELTHVIQQDFGNEKFTNRSIYPLAVQCQSSGTTRVIYLDANIIIDIANGDRELDRIVTRLSRHHDLRIVPQVELELNGQPNSFRPNRTAVTSAEANLAVLQRLGITVDRGGGLGQRLEGYSSSIEERSSRPETARARRQRLSRDPESRPPPTRRQTIYYGQESDVAVMVQVRAAGGKNAEILTRDGGIRANASRYGLRLAPDLDVRVLPPPQVVGVPERAGTPSAVRILPPPQAVGTPETGEVQPAVRTLPPPQVVGVPERAGTPSAVRVLPPPQAVGTPETGGAQPAVRTLPPPQVVGVPERAGTPSAVRILPPPQVLGTPETGGTQPAVSRPIPGFRTEEQARRTQLPERAALMLHAAQVAAIRRAQQERAEEALTQLTPRIERLRRQGYVVYVQLLMDEPISTPIARWLERASGFTEPGQIAYFHSLRLIFGTLDEIQARHRSSRQREATIGPELRGSSSLPESRREGRVIVPYLFRYYEPYDLVSAAPDNPIQVDVERRSRRQSEDPRLMEEIQRSVERMVDLMRMFRPEESTIEHLIDQMLGSLPGLNLENPVILEDLEQEMQYQGIPRDIAAMLLAAARRRRQQGERDLRRRQHEQLGRAQYEALGMPFPTD